MKVSLKNIYIYIYMFTWGQPANDKTIFFFFSLNFEMKLMLGLSVLNKITGLYRHISLVE